MRSPRLPQISKLIQLTERARAKMAVFSQTDPLLYRNLATLSLGGHGELRSICFARWLFFSQTPVVLVLVRTPVSAKKQPSGKTDAAQLPKPPQAQCCKVAVEEWIGLRKKHFCPSFVLPTGSTLRFGGGGATS